MPEKQVSNDEQTFAKRLEQDLKRVVDEMVDDVPLDYDVLFEGVVISAMQALNDLPEDLDLPDDAQLKPIDYGITEDGQLSIGWGYISSLSRVTMPVEKVRESMNKAEDSDAEDVEDE